MQLHFLSGLKIRGGRKGALSNEPWPCGQGVCLGVYDSARFE